MSLFRVFDIAGSALAAQTVRMNTVASNMANANSAASASGETYRARQPVFAPLVFDAMDFADDGATAGVSVEGVVESEAPLRREYQPNHPLADEQGYVFMPNVNMVEEMANMISASRSYQTNIEVMDASKRMLLQALSLGQ
ncbi:MAG: flagellar basal body rod protein FlgC [Gammaproteobacteria bacterium]|nr:flagellar basal body rod protein FlgC [Gammaproteobacteria bacterium]MCP5202308.1 flagellar basal body rod protein FlgC [Gammaproteobacteria bacterium]